VSRVACVFVLMSQLSCAAERGPGDSSGDEVVDARGGSPDMGKREAPDMRAKGSPDVMDDPGGGVDAAAPRERDAAMSPDARTPAPDMRTIDAPANGGTGGAGAGGTGGMSDAGLGGASRCKGAGLAVCESFEDAAAGTLPAGWNRRPGYGGKSMAVAADAAARGSHALKIEGGVNGSQFLEYKQGLGGLATEHWGRIFFRVKVPAPWPTTGVLHGDIVQHIGPHPGGGTNGVRWGIVENTQMKFQWIYNVQPSQGENEFGEGTAYNYTWPDRWQCLEWHYSQPTQQGAVWLDGTQLPITVGKNHVPEIPVFTSLGVGWANYQNAGGEGFVVWIDEVAFDPSRIGCGR
jgi:hypothetical protein